MNAPSLPKRGEVWLVNLPNTPGDPHQPRPAIVVSTNGRNQGCHDVIVVPTTSENIELNPNSHVAIAKGEGGLPKDSIVKCEQVTTLDKRFLTQGPLGAAIHRSIMWKIARAINYVIGGDAV